MKRSLIATYMKDFQCLGSTCEDTCCTGWAVEIDKKTFTKYKELPDKRMKRQLAQHVKRNKYETTFSDYARLKFGSNGFCPFLSSDQLCSIQMNLGESYLSKTCAGYPRQHSELFDTFEISGAVSCPEIARIALLNPAGITFVEEPGAPKEPSLDRRFADERYHPFFDELRLFIIDLLQNRSIPLEERLLHLGFFLQELSTLEEENLLEQIPQCISRYRELTLQPESVIRFVHGLLQDGLGTASDRMSDGGSAESATTAVASRNDFQLQFLRTMIDSYVTANKNHPRYQQCYQELVSAIGFSAEAYDQAYRTYYAPFMQQHGYIMENYVVNYVFSKVFPFFSNRSFYEEYVVLVLHYALVKMHLIGMGAFHQGLTQELVISLIQSFARTYEHDLHFFSDALQALFADELHTMPYMAILLEN